MFDLKKLEYWLDSLQVETHFSDKVPQRIVEPVRSILDEKMDRYDLFKQAGKEYGNVGTAEFPVLAPKSLHPFNNPMYLPMQWSTYVTVNRMSSYVMGIDTAEIEEPVKPIETSYDRLKTKLMQLEAIDSVEVINLSSSSSEKSPDFVHTITAWRGWGVTNGELEALGSSSRWEPRRALRANCRIGEDHAAPQMDCNCGYWSFRTKELLIQAMERYATSVCVIGQVEIWGRVIECENGFRSEYAYPKELWLLEDGLESLSWKYGVPVRRLK
jgi:hypothetical protein